MEITKTKLAIRKLVNKLFKKNEVCMEDVLSALGADLKGLAYISRTETQLIIRWVCCGYDIKIGSKLEVGLLFEYVDKHRH